MKVGKESIMGLLKALDLYENKDREKELKKQKEIVNYIVNNSNNIEGLKAKITLDEAGRKIYRAEVKVDKELLGIDAYEVVKKLNEGNPSIQIRKHKVNLGYITFDPRPIIEGDKEAIIERLKEIIKER